MEKELNHPPINFGKTGALDNKFGDTRLHKLV